MNTLFYRSERRRLLTALAVALAIHAGAALLISMSGAGSGEQTTEESGPYPVLSVSIGSGTPSDPVPSRQGESPAEVSDQEPSGNREGASAGDGDDPAAEEKSTDSNDPRQAVHTEQTERGERAEKQAENERNAVQEPAAEHTESKTVSSVSEKSERKSSVRDEQSRELVRRDFYPALGQAVEADFPLREGDAAGPVRTGSGTHAEGVAGSNAAVVPLADTVAELIAERKVYPQAARRRGLEGRVVFYLQIDGKGRLQSLELVESPETGILARAAERLVRSVFPLEPGKRFDTRSCKIAVRYRLK
jgi:TonB family protein